MGMVQQDYCTIDSSILVERKTRTHLDLLSIPQLRGKMSKR